MDSPSEVGKRLMAAREACRLPKMQVAKALGVHTSTVMRWENGDRPPKPSDMETLALIYQVDREWLLSGLPDVSPERSLERTERAKEMIQRLMEADPNAATLKGINIHTIRAAQHGQRAERRRSLGNTAEAAILDGITARIRPILLAQHRLPVIPGVSSEVILAIRNGVVVPSTDLICELARHLNVYSGWLLQGEPSKEQSVETE